jgi:hypothetical protein
MRIAAILLTLIFFPASLVVGAVGRNAPEFNGRITTGVGLNYRTDGDSYLFDFPIYGNLGVTYTTGIVESKVSLDYINEPSMGETYVKGGTKYSNLKIGIYEERWGAGYRSSPVSILNSRESRYPDNVFYQCYYRPNPIFSMTVGSERVHGQFVISGRDGVPSSIYDALLGTRLVGRWEGYDMSLGFVRCAGLPPSLFFLTAVTEDESSSFWSEIGWESSLYNADLGSMVLGYKRELRAASVIAEYAIWGANSLILVENVFHLPEQLDAGAILFLHFGDFRDAWSTAMNLYLRMGVGKGALLEPGIFLFFGKPGTFLGPHETENDNSVYLRFKFEF